MNRQRNLHDLAVVIREVNAANGFEAPTWENLPTKAVLVITEVGELVDAVNKWDPDNLREELADIAIRLTDILQSVWPRKWADRTHLATEVRHDHRPLFEPMEKTVWPVVKACINAVEAWRHDDQDDARSWLEVALKRTAEASANYGCDLLEEIERKVEINKSRGKWHGKAKAEG